MGRLGKTMVVGGLSAALVASNWTEITGEREPQVVTVEYADSTQETQPSSNATTTTILGRIAGAAPGIAAPSSATSPQIPELPPFVLGGTPVGQVPTGPLPEAVTLLDTPDYQPCPIISNEMTKRADSYAGYSTLTGLNQRRADVADLLNKPQSEIDAAPMFITGCNHLTNVIDGFNPLDAVADRTPLLLECADDKGHVTKGVGMVSPLWNTPGSKEAPGAQYVEAICPDMPIPVSKVGR